MSMIKLYDSKKSGNAWKVRLLLNHLRIPFERVTLDLANGQHMTSEFRAINNFQRVPSVVLGNGQCISESAAILTYFAEDTALLPQERVERAAVMSWLFFEQADLMRFLAYPRFFAMTGQTEARADVISHYRPLAESGLDIVEQALARNEWIQGSALSVADFALYPYIRLAPEGGFDLSRRNAIVRWFSQFENIDGFEPLLPGT